MTEASQPVRRTSWALVVAIVLGLPVSYIAIAYPLAFAFGAGWLPKEWGRTLDTTLYAPLNWYIRDDRRLGAVALRQSANWMTERGRQFSTRP